MATEFQRACRALEKLQESVSQLAGAQGEVSDWIVLATTSAAEHSISEDERIAFVEAEEKLLHLEELTVKMRKKCHAHEELQRLQAELERDASIGEVLLGRIAELQGTATYGRNMLEKVNSFLAQFDAAKERFTSEVVPRFAAAVAAHEAEEALCNEREHRQAELERSRAWEEQQKPLEELLASSEKRLQELQLAQQDSEWLRVWKSSRHLEMSFEEVARDARATKSIYS
ncbi:unnamed protein product [Cladocopium goreaui]|uniref:Reticulocyte-binding protein 2-like a n=1 Tax=Cladocopium goreaui TaxID=2562237 RepID=A0A9P1D5E9_9DINO|nr:unnamed protein product [Cladocopium goreaui]